MDEEAAREAAAREEEQKALQLEQATAPLNTASVEKMQAAETSAVSTHDLLQEDESRPSASTASDYLTAESLRENDSRDTHSISEEQHTLGSAAPGETVVLKIFLFS